MNSTTSPSNNRPMIKSMCLEEEDVQGKKISLSSGDIIRLPDDLLRYIFTFLSNERDLFACELLCNKVIHHTGRAWKCLAKQERLDMDWSLPNQEKQNLEKAHYLHGKVLIVYSKARAKLWKQAPDRQVIPPSPQEMQKLFQRFERIMKQYPSSLGAFLWKDLNALHRFNSPKYDQLFQRNFSIELNPGDFLLKGLSYLSEHILLNDNQENDQRIKLRRKASLSLKQAILKGATCASYLAIQILHPNYLDPLWYYYLTLASANQDDYRGLELLLDKFPDVAELFYNQGVSDPPILVEVSKAKFHNNFIQREELLDTAIEGYKDHVPPFVYAEAALVKLLIAHHEKNLGVWIEKFKEAEGYYTKALATYGDNVPANVYREVVLVKIISGKLEEAEGYSIKALAAYGDNIPAEVYADAGHLKFLLNKLQESDSYYTKAIAACGDNVVPDYINAGAAELKSKLNEYKNL